MDDWRNRLMALSKSSRFLFYAILIALITAALVAFFNSRIGTISLTLCCGGGIVLVIVGLLSERGMRR